MKMYANETSVPHIATFLDCHLLLLLLF